MFRRILTAVLVAVDLASASAALSGQVDNVAYPCPAGARNSGPVISSMVRSLRVPYGRPPLLKFPETTSPVGYGSRSAV